MIILPIVVELSVGATIVVADAVVLLLCTIKVVLDAVEVGITAVFVITCAIVVVIVDDVAKEIIRGGEYDELGLELWKVAVVVDILIVETVTLATDDNIFVADVGDTVVDATVETLFGNKFDLEENEIENIFFDRNFIMLQSMLVSIPIVVEDDMDVRGVIDVFLDTIVVVGTMEVVLVDCVVVEAVCRDADDVEIVLWGLKVEDVVGMADDEAATVLPVVTFKVVLLGSGVG